MSFPYPTEWPQFCTASKHKWVPLLAEDRYKEIIIRRLQFMVPQPDVQPTSAINEAKARKQSERGIPASSVAQATINALRSNAYEVIVGQAKVLKAASRIAPRFFHKLLNKLAAR